MEIQGGEDLKQKTFHLKRARDVQLYVCCWFPDNLHQAKGVVQIAHGMAEHMMRYDDFSSILVAQGFIVIGNDHRGHGRSVQAPDDWGFLAGQEGFDKLTEDMHAVTQYIQTTYPDLPLFLMGHSMGSFLARRYMQFYSNKLTGVLLLGTGGSQGVLGKIGKFIAKSERLRKGPRSSSPLMNELTFGRFNKAFKPVRTAFDFLTRDVSEVDAYIHDPYCGFICSTSFYIDLLHGIERIHDQAAQKNISRSLPVFLLSGEADPVGNFGDGVRQVYNMYHQLGMKDVHIQLYPDARHDILHEKNKQEIQSDIIAWLDAKL